MMWLVKRWDFAAVAKVGFKKNGWDLFSFFGLSHQLTWPLIIDPVIRGWRKLWRRTGGWR